jgi:spore germination cell wall hydrolase CwlJ-like protein
MKPEAFKKFSDLQLMAGLFFGEARRVEDSELDELKEFTAIGQVVMNRLNSARWPSTVYGVILQPKQFSCFNENDPNNEMIWLFLANELPKKLYARAIACATFVLNRMAKDYAQGADHYVAQWFYEQKIGTNHWCQNMDITAHYGGHIFLWSGKV